MNGCCPAHQRLKFHQSETVSRRRATNELAQCGDDVARSVLRHHAALAARAR
jgi:hypothetical protein